MYAPTGGRERERANPCALFIADYAAGEATFLYLSPAAALSQSRATRLIAPLSPPRQKVIFSPPEWGERSIARAANEISRFANLFRPPLFALKVERERERERECRGKDITTFLSFAIFSYFTYPARVPFEK